MSEYRSYREASKTNWGTNKPGMTLEQINCGALLRIADAVELMAKRHAELIAQKAQAERSRDYFSSEFDTAVRRLNATRGQVTKLKKQLAALKEAA